MTLETSDLNRNIVVCSLGHSWYLLNLCFAFVKGDYVIVDPIEEGEKVKAEISFILYKDHIQYLQKQQQWWVDTHTHTHMLLLLCKWVWSWVFTLTSTRPEGFMKEPSEQDKTNKQQLKGEGTEEKDEEDSSDSEDDESDLFVNTNRCNYQYSESEDEEDSEDEDEDEEEKEENGS